MGAQAEALYQMFAGLGGGPLDFSAIIKLIDGSWRAPAASAGRSRRFAMKVLVPGEAGDRL